MKNFQKVINIFVPGRLCLIGEHSDWSGLYKTINSNIIPGRAIVTGIEQGIYAKVTYSIDFHIDYEIENMKNESFVCSMDSEKLKEVANEGGFFSYCAGVVSYINDNFNVDGGIHITITKMDLPMKSGLSSSASICVLIARAFNRLYNFNWSISDEMSIAYHGEQRTPSRCGRLDQACAYGKIPISMTFNGDEISVKPLFIKESMYFVIANLKGQKNTIKILADLNKCFPFAETEIDKNVHEALGYDNDKFIEQAINLIQSGDNKNFGKLMTEYQINFDKKVAPACISELKSPILHSLMNDDKLKKWIYGCKGVGSQGDGSIQFLAKDEECQEKIIKYLNDEKGLESFSLTIHPRKKIHKAIIPIAGFGTRMFPISKYIKKDFLPVMDKDGILKPVILILIEQLINAGIDEICLIIGEGEQDLYDSFFSSISNEYFDKLSDDKKKYENFIESLQDHITYVIQNEKLGLGHAVYQTYNFTNNESVVLILGDMIYDTQSEKNSITQIIDLYEKCESPIIAMHSVNEKDVMNYGIMTGKWEDKEQKILKLTEVCEKPSIEYAKNNLSTSNNFYAAFGQYVITKEIYEQLGENIKHKLFENNEIQLTTAFEQVRKNMDIFGYLINGKFYDVGIPEKYIETIIGFGK